MSTAAEPSQSPLRPRAALHEDAASACLADRGIIEITIAHLIAARETKAPSARIQAMEEQTKDLLRHSIGRFESVHNFVASLKLLGLLYALDPTQETLTFVLERLRAAEQWEMVQVVQQMLTDRARRPT